VPADPRLAPLFGGAPPGQAQRLAEWLAGALGGPAPDGPADLRQVTGFTSDGLGEQERARWVMLAGTAASECALPADPAFRSALSACLDWLSRSALAQPPAGAPGPAGNTPRWDWGPGGPPASATPDADQAGPAAAGQLPGPGEPVGFAAHIRPLFRERDRQSMSFVFDLWSGDDVRAHAAEILQRLQDGSMPCDGAWPADRIEVFARWRDSGMQP
jgi:truncated hemoglobin YjbI